MQPYPLNILRTRNYTNIQTLECPHLEYADNKHKKTALRKINRFVGMSDVGEKSNPRKRMKLARETSFEKQSLNSTAKKALEGFQFRQPNLNLTF